MQETPVPTIGYESTSTGARKPKVWVFAVLTIVYLFAIMCGFHVWSYLDQPGKDPQLELGECGAIGLVVAAIAYALYFRRSWRLTFTAIAVAFLLGAITGLSAVALHLHRHGWY
jgi:hypothetical protein